MTLKPQNIDFQETWANLKETVSGVVGLRNVERGVWNMRFSDVYALCVAHPEPLADRLYDETKAFLEEHVTGLLQRVRGAGDDEGLLTRYVEAWEQYSQGVSYLNCLYSYLNIQHVKRHKVSDAEIIYGSAATVICPEHDSRQLEVGELGLVIWERVLVGELGARLSSRIVSGLSAARDSPGGEWSQQETVRRAVHSLVAVQSFRVRAPLSLYHSLVLEPYLELAGAQHAASAAAWLAEGDISRYMRLVLDGLRREVALAARLLHTSSGEAVRACYERHAVTAHLPQLHAHTARLLREANDADVDLAAQRREDLRRMYTLLRPLGDGGTALRPLVEAARAQAERDGRALLNAPHPHLEAHTHFVNSMLSLHGQYSALFADVFDGGQPFMGALDKACAAVVNGRVEGGSGGTGGEAGAEGGEGVASAPELLARYCDALLRRRNDSDGDGDDKLTAAILVFKYIDDKDVFQKHYARALARRLIHQLSANMDQEEAMINRLKAACGYEFTNKLHRMFTDVAVSADLNAKFQQHLRDNNHENTPGFFVQVLQAGAWPLGGAMAPLAPPAALERPARLFESFYRASFSGRRLAWLHHLCTGEMRTRYTARVHHLSASPAQCALLLAFQHVDRLPVHELRQLLSPGDAWERQLRPLLDAGLLRADGEVVAEDADGALTLNLSFSSKRTRLRLTCAPQAPSATSSSASTAAQTDDDRKMYLQAALVRIMKQRKVVRHNELIQEVVSQARGSFAPSVAMIKKCIEALIDKQYLERAPGSLDTYSYLA